MLIKCIHRNILLTAPPTWLANFNNERRKIFTGYVNLFFSCFWGQRNTSLLQLSDLFILSTYYRMFGKITKWLKGYIAFPRNYKNKICAGKQRLPWLRNSGRNEFSMVKSWNTKRFKLVCLHHQQTWNIKHIQMNLQNVFCDIIILINILKTVE